MVRLFIKVPKRQNSQGARWRYFYRKILKRINRDIDEIGFVAVKLYSKIYKVIGWANKKKDFIQLKFCPTEQQIKEGVDVKEQIISTNYPLKIYFKNEVIYCVQ